MDGNFESNDGESFAWDKLERTTAVECVAPTGLDQSPAYPPLRLRMRSPQGGLTHVAPTALNRGCAHILRFHKFQAEQVPGHV